MTEINLLPDDLREKESKELKSVRKEPKVFNIEMSSPAKTEARPPLKVPKPSLLSRLFAKNIKSNKPTAAVSSPLVERSEAAKVSRGEKMVFHVPKMAEENGGLDSNLSVGKVEKPESQLPEKREPVTEKISIKPKEAELSRGEIKTTVDIAKPKKEKKKFRWWIFGQGKKAKPIEIKTKESKAVKEEKIKREKIIDVNLIPAELAKHPELELPKKLSSGGMVIFIFILLAVTAYLGMTWYQLKITRQIEEIEIKIDDLNQQIAQYEKGKLAALELESYLALVRQLLDNHVYWTKFFGLLEDYTIEDVYYSNFSMAGKEKLVIAAVGKDYNSVAKQLVAFQQASDFVKDVRIDAASAEINPETGTYNGVSFNINLELLPDVFLKPIE